VACVDANKSKPNLGIEPLPDIDFNIRAGNALVGYARLEDAQTTAENANIDMDLYGTKSVLREKSKALAQIVKTYRQQQLDMESNVDKQAVKVHLAETAEALNQRLAALYGVDVRNRAAYTKWLTSHEPFHWCSEFYEIVEERGGFDVIIGNPPYVGYPKVRNDYQVLSYQTEKSANLYAFVIERCTKLFKSNSYIGYIVPIASISTDGMNSLQKLYLSYTVWHSNYAVRPGKLFNGVDMNLTISIMKVDDKNKTYTTPYYRWSANKDLERDSRHYLLNCVSYTNSIRLNQDLISTPKTDTMGINILSKLGKFKQKIEDISGKKSIYYHSGGRYWRKANLSKLSSHYKEVKVNENVHDFVYVLLNSSLYYWYWIVFSNCMDVVSREVDKFRVPNITTIPQDVVGKLSDFYESSGVNRIRSGELIHTTEVNYKMKDAKPIIDEIDRVLAQHYGFSDEELDYIINYDIKYRMGRAGAEGDDGGEDE